MSKLKLFIHIGTGKTGTSAIQNTLAANRDVLVKKNRILYPGFNVSGFLPTKDHQGHNNHSEFFGRIKKLNDPILIAEKFKDLFSYCRQNDINTLILSNEGLFLSGVYWPSIFKDVFVRNQDDIDLKFILYLRRQDLFLESSWKQWGVKDQHYQSIHEYYEGAAKNNRWDYYSILNNWLQCFDKSHFIVNTFERSSIGKDVVKHFLQIISSFTDRQISDIELLSKKNVNIGFTPEIIDLLALFKQANIHDHKLLHFLGENLPEKYLKSDPFKSYGILSWEERIKILKEHQTGNHKIAQLFFSDSRETLFLDNNPEPDSIDKNQTETKKGESYIKILVELLLQQDAKLKQLTKEVKSIQDRFRKIKRVLGFFKKIIQPFLRLKNYFSNQK